MNAQHQYPYYIRVTNVDLFNRLVASAEESMGGEAFYTTRQHGYYELRTSHESLWRDLGLYGQMIAQAEDEFFEVGEDRP